MSKCAPALSYLRRSLCRAGLVLMLWLMAHSCRAQEPDWRDYATLLTAHVAPGTRFGIALNLVDYRALAADPHYPAALKALADFPVTRLEGVNQQLAFYINAYNLLTIKMVVDHQPLASIKDVGSFWWPVWKREAGKLGGEPVSLDDIEHQRLRTLHEPRVHFAIVCASLSCPDLRNEPYRGAVLEAQLDEQARGYLTNPGKGLRIDGERVRISKIFSWFAEDFSAAGGVETFIARYHALPPGVEVEATLDYDWRLNGP